MRLCTYSPVAGGEPRPGIVVDRWVIDIPRHAKPDAAVDFSSMLGIIRGGAPARVELDRIVQSGGEPLRLTEVRLHAPIPRPTKQIFCVGWNYLEHFAEGARKLGDDRQLPQWPVFFSKAPTTVIGPTDTIPYDAAISTSLDWEVELAVVIGTACKNLTESNAMAHVFGYTVINDVTWRDIQRRHGGQWDKGKSLDGTCPMGPVIVTADELDPTALRVTCRVNGVTKQDSNTKFLYFKLPRILQDLSVGMTLEPGDIISTGTPEGVGYARNPPEFLKPGDLLETEVDGIGVLRNPVGD